MVVDWPSGKRSVLLGVATGFHLVDEAGAVGVPVAPRSIASRSRARDRNPSRGGASAILRAAARRGRATLALYSIAGRKVRTLFDGPRAPGRGREAFDGRDDAGVKLAPGVYALELSAGGEHARAKLVVLP